MKVSLEPWHVTNEMAVIKSITREYGFFSVCVCVLCLCVVHVYFMCISCVFLERRLVLQICYWCNGYHFIKYECVCSVVIANAL